MAATPLSPTTVAHAVFKVQEALLDGVAASDRRLLLSAGDLLSRPDYRDVVEERSIDDRCGNPLCPNPLPPTDARRRGRFHIALREHRVYDLEEAHKYCSEACLVDSSAFAASLPAERTTDLSTSKVESVLDLFSRRGDPPETSAELGKDENLAMSKLTIREKEDAANGELALNEWIGPTNAIDGYVPQFDLKQESKLKYKEKSLKNRKNVRSEENFRNNKVGYEEVVFDSLGIKTKDVSEAIAKKLDQMVLEENKSKKNKKNSKRSDSMGISGAKSTGPSIPKASSYSRDDASEKLDFTSAVLVNDWDPQTSEREVSKHKKQSGKNFNEQGVNSKNRDSMGKDSLLKSSLRTSGTKNTDRSVKWADEVDHFAQEERKDSLEGTNMTRDSHDEENDSSLRLVSAEACAAALSEAAEAVASGLSEAVDAVSEAGLLILPQPQTDNETLMDDEIMEIDRGYVKWPKKTVLLDTDFFEVEDSWHDTPPDGFSLTLSPFATLYMALFGWVTRSTLAYIYGYDGSHEDEFSVVDGREYPCKFFLSDGQSSEIRRTIEGCICRALPGLVRHLNISIPLSALEKALGLLLDTMSFMEALPSFKLRQWQVIVLMFLEGLSVHRLPVLSSYLTREVLLQTVLNAAHVTGEEYESMRDLIIPRDKFPGAKWWIMTE